MGRVQKISYETTKHKTLIWTRFPNRLAGLHAIKISQSIDHK